MAVGAIVTHGLSSGALAWIVTDGFGSAAGGHVAISGITSVVVEASQTSATVAPSMTGVVLKSS